MRKKVLLRQNLIWMSHDHERHQASVKFDNGWKLVLEHYTRWKQPADKTVWVATYAPNGERAYFFGTFNYENTRYATHGDVELPWEALTDFAKWVTSFERRHAYLSAYDSIQKIADEVVTIAERKENHAEA